MRSPEATRETPTDCAAGATAQLRHRLANCFQLIGGLVRLRLAEAESAEARAHLTWLLDAITAVSLLQQRLLAEEDASFQGYLREAAPVWRSRARDGAVTISVEAADDLAIPVGIATSLALITHELVVTSLEHGFPKGQAGEIVVRLRSCSDALRGELVVEDDGIGRAEGASGDGTAAAMLSSTLVRLLAAQLGGSFDVGLAGDGARGTAARLRFRL